MAFSRLAPARDQLLASPLRAVQLDGDLVVGRLHLRALVDDGLVEERAVLDAFLLLLLEDVVRIDALALELGRHPGVPPALYDRDLLMLPQ